MLIQPFDEMPGERSRPNCATRDGRNDLEADCFPRAQGLDGATRQRVVLIVSC